MISQQTKCRSRDDNPGVVSELHLKESCINVKIMSFFLLFFLENIVIKIIAVHIILIFELLIFFSHFKFLTWKVFDR